MVDALPVPDLFQKFQLDEKSKTGLGKLLTIFIPFVLVFATIYLGCVNFVVEESKYTISSEATSLIAAALGPKGAGGGGGGNIHWGGDTSRC